MLLAVPSIFRVDRAVWVLGLGCCFTYTWVSLGGGGPRILAKRRKEVPEALKVAAFPALYNVLQERQVPIHWGLVRKHLGKWCPGCVVVGGPEGQRAGSQGCSVTPGRPVPALRFFRTCSGFRMSRDTWLRSFLVICKLIKILTTGFENLEAEV